MPKAAVLYWNTYRYFEYEQELARREVAALLAPTEIASRDKALRIVGDFKESDLRRLVYFSRYRLNGEEHSTLQNALERSSVVNGTHRRQSTRYSVHGLHEYKGKFNPQVVRGVLNGLGISPQSKILDPFCGSGTTLVECAHAGMSAIGFDLNPLAVAIANAKLKSLSIPASRLKKRLAQLQDAYSRSTVARISADTQADERDRYLSKWFTPETLAEIEKIRSLIINTDEEISDILLMLASDLVRDYSLQEPTDLRIRRRYSPLPDLPLFDAFMQKTTQFVDNLAATQQIIDVQKIDCHAVLFDSRQLAANKSQVKPRSGFHAALTSPPYATALPYIDTQRLSLVWLGLITAGEIAELDAHLTGSREFIKTQKQFWDNALEENSKRLPLSEHEYCLTLKQALSRKDGFRRQSMPALMYRYLSDMQDVFAGMHKILRSGAPFALIVGHNRTTLGGKRFEIDTPALLRNIAVSLGFEFTEAVTLQTYQRYGSHMNNAVQAETLLIVRKP
jgi:site-specific DNA-methyltransferase (cytosine-N4-specific)